MLDLDITVIYTIIILWTLLVLLNRFFYKPVGKIISEREGKSKTENLEIEKMRSDIEERSAQIESIMKTARRDSAGISEEIIRNGESAREELLNTTRQRTSEDFKKRMVSLGQEINGAEEKLKGDIKKFSKKIEEIFS